MSPQNSADITTQPVVTPGEAVQKQQVNVYTMMLIIAFLSISIACLLLWLELKRWGSWPWWDTRSAQTTSMIMQPAELPLYQDRVGRLV